jgi:hypothetical protein
LPNEEPFNLYCLPDNVRVKMKLVTKCKPQRRRKRKLWWPHWICGWNRFVNLICGKRKGEIREDEIKGHVACGGSVMCTKFWSERMKKSNHLKTYGY